MASSKKKKSSSKSKRPSVPEAQSVPALSAPSEMARPEYEPMSINDFNNWMDASYQKQLQYAPQLIESQRQAQDVLYRNMGALQREQAPLGAATANQLLQDYNPEFRAAYQQQAADIGLLGKSAKEGLAAGYDLGPGLSREIEQSIRGAQTARGNILGAAPTAQEAFGKGQASIDLYNQRYSQYGDYLGAQQNYIQGRNPTDMMSQMAGTFMGSTYYPSQSYVDTGLGASAMATAQSGQSAYNATVESGYSSFQSALQSYNSNQISATAANNESMFAQYDRAADYWQYDEAVRRGLYSTPSTSSGGGMGSMGGMGTAIGGAVGGLATAGVAAAGGSAALAGGIGAAVSAAGAAICWLARRCIPQQWEDFQRWLFTDAPEKLRRLYIFRAQRLAREVSDAEAREIAELMTLCLR